MGNKSYCDYPTSNIDNLETTVAVPTTDQNTNSLCSLLYIFGSPINLFTYVDAEVQRIYCLQVDFLQ